METLTEKELAVIACFVSCYFVTEAGDIYDHSVWSDFHSICENSDDLPRAKAAGVNQASFPGVLGSLVKKGFAGVDGTGKDATAWLTREGYEAYRAARAEPAAELTRGLGEASDGYRVFFEWMESVHGNKRNTVTNYGPGWDLEEWVANGRVFFVLNMGIDGFEIFLPTPNNLKKTWFALGEYLNLPAADLLTC